MSVSIVLVPKKPTQMKIVSVISRKVSAISVVEFKESVLIVHQVDGIWWKLFNYITFLFYIFGQRKNYYNYYRGSPTSTVSTRTISTSTNFQKVLHKVVLVGDLISKFVLVELTVCTTQLVWISHSTIFSRSQKSY